MNYNSNKNKIEYLDFEIPIKELKDKLKECIKLSSDDIDMTKVCDDINKKIKEKQKEIYSKLSTWQRVQLSRHPNRPYFLDYASFLTNDDFIELHGDRGSGDDKAMVTVLGKIKDIPFVILGQQKGINTKMRQYRNFGMTNPEGYRKALRVMKLAEKFNMPILTLIDTPGAYPGVEAEMRGQAEAIAKNIYEMSILKVPIISIIIGEGASGGALGIGVGDKVFMLENTWYSVISPESCSSILWRNTNYKEKASEVLKLTSYDMKKNKLIDGIIKEPIGGAHSDRKATFIKVKNLVIREYNKLKELDVKDRINKRRQRFFDIGIYGEK